MPAPLPPPIAALADVPYPGTITLSVDATNVNDRIFTVHETIPVKGKQVTLLYPEWIRERIHHRTRSWTSPAW